MICASVQSLPRCTSNTAGGPSPCKKCSNRGSGDIGMGRWSLFIDGCRVEAGRFQARHQSLDRGAWWERWSGRQRGRSRRGGQRPPREPSPNGEDTADSRSRVEACSRHCANDRRKTPRSWRVCSPSEQGKPLNGLGSRFEIGGAVAWTRHTSELSLPPEVLQDGPEGRVELHRKPISASSAPSRRGAGGWLARAGIRGGKGR